MKNCFCPGLGADGRRLWRTARTVGLLVVLAASAAAAERVDGFGLVDLSRPTPAYRLSRVKTPSGDFRVVLRLKGGGEFRLAEDCLADRVWNGVAARHVRMAWLAGARDLLLVRWLDRSLSDGLGRLIIERFLVARVGKGKPRVLLRTAVLSAAPEPPAEPPELGKCFFSYDAGTKALTERREYRRVLAAEKPFLLATPGFRVAPWVHEINEVVTFTWTDEGKALKLQTATLDYVGRKGQDLTDIARLYLGAVAPIAPLVNANPGITNSYHAGSTELRARKAVRIPVPSAWVVRAYAAEP